MCWSPVRPPTGGCCAAEAVGGMIRYTNAAFHPRLLFTAVGSAFPFSLKVAVPCAIVAAASQILRQQNVGEATYFFSNILTNNAAYTAFTFLCGFLVVFRTQQGYGRFWGGCNSIKAMQAEWFAAASNLVAFCRHSDCPQSQILQFHHVLLRLMSMLHAVSMAQLEGIENDDEPEEPAAHRLQLIDVRGLDRQSLDSVQNVDCSVEMILQWVQSLTVHNIKTGVLSIPPPILARVFHNLSNGLASFQQAHMLTDVPYPFPFMQATELLLVLHWLVTPMVMCQFTTSPMWTAIFSFLATFILWTLNTISTELENPFGQDANDLNIEEMQSQMNKRLLTLLWPGSNRLPNLSEWAVLDEAALHHPASMVSLQQVWQEIEQGPSATMDDKNHSRTKVRFSFEKQAQRIKRRSRKSGASFKGPLKASGSLTLVSTHLRGASQKDSRGSSTGTMDSCVNVDGEDTYNVRQYLRSDQGEAPPSNVILRLPQTGETYPFVDVSHVSSSFGAVPSSLIPRENSRETASAASTQVTSLASAPSEYSRGANTPELGLGCTTATMSNSAGGGVNSPPHGSEPSSKPSSQEDRSTARSSGGGDVHAPPAPFASRVGRSQDGFRSLAPSVFPIGRHETPACQAVPNGPACMVPPANCVQGDTGLDTPRSLREFAECQV